MQIASELFNRIGFKPADGHDGHQPPPTVPFSGVLHQAAEHLQQLDTEASESVDGLLQGNGTDIHAALIATQKAGLAFDAALAVRNKAVGAYQQIMGMQF